MRLTYGRLDRELKTHLGFSVIESSDVALFLAIGRISLNLIDITSL